MLLLNHQSLLFSPTGVASTVKVLSALFVSTDHYSLGSIDIGDAYLQVEQDERTRDEGRITTVYASPIVWSASAVGTSLRS